MTIWKTIKDNPSVLAWANIVHLLAFIAIGVSFKVSDPNMAAVKKERVIEAVAIDESKIKEEINKLKKADKRKKREIFRATPRKFPPREYPPVYQNRRRP